MLYDTYLANQQSCPFCHLTQPILADLPHAFLTIANAPYHEHHMLVIPRAHICDLTEIDSHIENDMDSLRNLAMEMLRTLGHPNSVILTRNGKNAGKSIAHLHQHVIPDIHLVAKDLTDREVLTEGEIATELEQLQQALASVRYYS